MRIALTLTGLIALLSLGLLAHAVLRGGGLETRAAMAPVEPGSPAEGAVDARSQSVVTHAARGAADTEAPRGARAVPDPAPCLLGVRTLSDGGTPRAAQVFAARPQEPAELLGTSDTTGRLEVALAPGPWTLLALAEGAGPGRMTVQLLSGRRELTLSLATQGELAGSVNRWDGSPAGEGVTVVLVDALETEAPRLARAARAGLADPRLHQTRTDVAGSFRFTGLDAARAYRVAAAEAGTLASAGAPTRPGSAVTLVLRPLYARALHFVGAFGAAVDGRLGYAGAAGGGLSFGRLPPPGRWLEPRMEPALALTALGPNLTASYEADGPRILLAVAERDAPPRLGPLPIRLQLPGWEARSEELWLEPVSAGLAESTLGLTPSGPTGSLSIDAHFGAPVAEALEREGRPLGALHLVQPDARPLQIELPALGGLPMVLEGVPVGEWEAVFVSRDGALGRLGVARAGQVVAIDPGRTAELVLALSDAAALEVTLGERGRPAWEGAAVLTLAAAGRQPCYPSLARAPYVMLDLAPGEWHVGLRRIPGSPVAPAGAEPSVVVLRPGRSTWVELALGR